MKKIVVLLLLCFWPIVSFSQSEYDGIWEGKLNFNNMELRLVFKIRGDKDSLTALMDSPDQGAKDIPVNSVLVSDTSIRLNVNIINGYFEGNFIKDSMLIDGKWYQGGMSLPLVLKKTDKVEEVKRPQNPVKPYPYNEEEVVFKNVKANVELAGTFTYPKSGSTFPAVILVSGSGMQDRDETLLNHKPFLVLSDYLTRNGIAVLRYDDRGAGKSTGDFTSATTMDFTYDALAAVEYLMTRKEVDKNKIGIVGHSEGGLIAPLAANRNKNISFIILMAGPGIKGEDILLKQSRLIAKAEGASDEEIEKDIAISERIYKIIQSEKDSASQSEEISGILKNYFASLSDEQKKGMPESDMMLKQQVSQMTSPWFRFFVSYDPYPELKKLQIPVLAVIGEKDLQVPAPENIKAIKKALTEGENNKFKVLELPGLNHLFQKAVTGSVSEYSKIEETISPDALELIKSWILEISDK